MEYTPKTMTPEEFRELKAKADRVAERERIAYEFEEDLMIMSVEEALARREERLRQAGRRQPMEYTPKTMRPEEFRELKAKADRVAERELRAYEKDEDMTSEVVRRAAERYRARQQAQK